MPTGVLVGSIVGGGVGSGRALLAAAVVASTLLVVGSDGVDAAGFTRATSAAVSATAATVQLSLDDSGSALFSVTGLKPGDDPVMRCVTVTNTGSLPLTGVGLYVSSVSGSGLGSYLDLSILRADTSGSTAPDCSSMGGGTAIYGGTLSGFPSTSAADLSDGAGGLAVGDSRAYEIDLSLLDDPAAQGRTTSFTLTWVGSS